MPALVITSPLLTSVIEYVIRHHIPIIFTLIFIFVNILLLRTLNTILTNLENYYYAGTEVEPVLAVQRKTLDAREELQQWRDLHQPTTTDMEGETNDKEYFQEEHEGEGERQDSKISELTD